MKQAERALGHPLPPLLRAIYLKLGNGGFGPGYGILGIGDGYRHGDATLTSAGGLLTICFLSDVEAYVIDCGQPEFPVFLVENGTVTERVGPFAEVLDNWAAGKD